MNSIARCSCLGVLFLISSARALSLSTDRRLLALVPPESAVVAGVGLSPRAQRPIGNPLIISKISWEDIRQFLAWTGVDASREIHQLVIASLDFVPGDVIQHSLLAKGHYDGLRIYNSLIRNGGTSRTYRGVEIVTVPQVPSHANRADEAAPSLAVLDDQILLLGSEVMMQEEVDRYVDGMKPDPTLLQRVEQLDPDDVAWSMVAISGRTKEIEDLLSSLDLKLPLMRSDREMLVFGVHFRRHVRLEFRVLTDFKGTAHGWSSTFLPAEQQIVRSDVLLSRKAYMKWLTGYARAGPASTCRSC